MNMIQLRKIKYYNNLKKKYKLFKNKFKNNKMKTNF